MQLIADQNIHRRVIVRLREADYAFEHILETMRGISDEEVLARPDMPEAVLITGDKGFGDWIFNRGLPCPFAILLNRLPHPERANAAERIIACLERGVASGQMITIARGGDRSQPFPLGVSNA